MRKIINFADKELQKKQFDTLVEIFSRIKTKKEMRLFLSCLLSDSERAYLGQRLNIVRMLAKYFSYAQIKGKLGVPNSTIAFANKIFVGASADFKKIITSYKFKIEQPEPDQSTESDTSSKPLIRPHYPGAINF